MLKKYIALGSLVAVSAFAGDMGTPHQPPAVNLHPWSIAGSLGYTYYGNTNAGGGTPVGRFAVAKDIYNLGDSSLDNDLVDMSRMNLGLEFGVQSGNRMSLGASQQALNNMGGLPVWSTVNPLLDLLGTLRFAPMANSGAFLSLKGGVVWRQWNLERDTINNLSQAGGEIQAGIGMPVADAASLSILYQGIFGSSANFTSNPETGLGHVSNIPVQNGVLLTATVVL